MNTDLAMQYYLKAVDNFPYNLEFTIENLNYALSYDPCHVQSMTLMGVIEMYIMKDYPKAKRIFYDAIASNKSFPDTYKMLATLHIWLGEFEYAERVIDFAMKQSACNFETMYRIQAMKYEYKGQLKKAKKALQKAQFYAFQNDQLNVIKMDLTRVNSKLKKVKKERKRRMKKKNFEEIKM